MESLPDLMELSVFLPGLSMLIPKRALIQLEDHPNIKGVYSLRDNTYYLNKNASPSARDVKIIK